MDGCRVDPAATRDLLGAARPGRITRVFVEDGRLVGYLARGAGPDTPAAVHDACVALLPEHPVTATPGRYVLCADAPTDPEDGSGWRAQPVLSTGTGRAPRAI